MFCRPDKRVGDNCRKHLNFFESYDGLAKENKSIWRQIPGNLILKWHPNTYTKAKQLWSKKEKFTYVKFWSRASNTSQDLWPEMVFRFASVNFNQNLLFKSWVDWLATISTVVVWEVDNMVLSSSKMGTKKKKKLECLDRIQIQPVLDTGTGGEKGRRKKRRNERWLESKTIAIQQR